MTVFARKLADDIEVEGDVGHYGRIVFLRLDSGSLSIELELDPEQAREVGLALMDAASAVEKAPLLARAER